MANNNHIHGVLDFAVTGIRNANLKFEYEAIKSWWYSNSSIIDWCQTLSNELFYSFIFTICLITISLVNNAIILDKTTMLKKFFIPFKIFFEAIIIYYLSKISVLFIAYPIGGFLLLLNSNIFQFIGLILFLLIFLIIFIFINLFVLISSNYFFVKKY